MTVEPGAVIGARAEIGTGTVIGANVVVGHDVRIGRNCHVAANVTLIHCLLGNRVIIHSGTRVGQDGFGFAMGIKGHVLEPGGNADLVVLNAEDVYHAIWEHDAPLHVIRKGKDVTLK